MIAATVLAVFFVPVFYVVMQSLSEWRRKPAEQPEYNTSTVKRESNGAPAAMPSKRSVHVGP